MPTVTIDGKNVEVEKDATILDAAKKAGVWVPTLCYHEAISCDASCRLCMVELDRGDWRQLVTACNYPVRRDIVVYVSSERAKQARQGVMELLLARAPDSRELKALAEDGLPIYAECGGLMYLAKELAMEGDVYPMADVLPLTLDLSPRPQGHGYTIVHADKENPYFEIGMELRGHEFHYSRVLKWQGTDDDLVFAMKRGSGVIQQRDGIVYKNVLATYTHLHALGTPVWAEALVRNAAVRRAKQK